jgi:NAD-dependent SIR2 family protein deacetylase
MEAAIAEARVIHCEEEDCGSLVKPNIVFFGESVSDLALIPLSVQTLGIHRARLTPFT